MKALTFEILVSPDELAFIEGDQLHVSLVAEMARLHRVVDR